MKRYLGVFLMLAPVLAWSQDTAKAPVYGWQHNIISGLALSQVAYTNWTQGGENALAYTLSLLGKSALDEPQENWTTEYKFAFGQTRLGDQGLRKTDDKIDLSTVYTFKLGTYINPYAAATFKSQFAKGYQYDNTGGKTAVSDFFDPAYITQSAGVGYQPFPELKTRLGFALREIVTSKFPMYADDPATTAIEKTSVRGGLESVTELEWHLDDNLVLSSKLELFDAFKTMDVIIMRNDNTLAAKVNKYVTVILNVQMINEKPISPRTQVKEALAIGLSYTLL